MRVRMIRWPPSAAGGWVASGVSLNTLRHVGGASDLVVTGVERGTLAGTSTYTGSTTVLGAELVVNGSTWLIASAGGGISLNGVGLSANTDYSGYFNIQTAAVNGTEGWSGPVPLGGFRISTLGNSSNLYLIADAAGVPEPGQLGASVLLLCVAGLLIFLRRRGGADSAIPR